MLETASALLIFLFLFADGCLVLIYWRLRDQSITTLGAALPRFYLALFYLVMAVYPLPLADRVIWARSGILWLGIAEVVHFLVYFLQRRGNV